DLPDRNRYGRGSSRSRLAVADRPPPAHPSLPALHTILLEPVDDRCNRPHGQCRCQPGERKRFSTLRLMFSSPIIASSSIRATCSGLGSDGRSGLRNVRVYFVPFAVASKV